MDLGLKGARAIVTGATKGIGRAIAEVLADEGADVAFCARNDAEIKEAVTSLQEKGVRAYGARVDVSDGESYSAWLEAAVSELGGCDIFIPNVSGGNIPGEKGWRRNFEFDVLGTVRGIDILVPHLSNSANGNIIIISTTAALEHFIQASPYGAMKAGLISYAGALANDLAAKGIRVNCVSPGPVYVDGGTWDKIRNNMPSLYEQTLKHIPLGRFGNVQDVAKQVVFLASECSSFTTGTNVVIDGGFTRKIQF